MNEIITVIDVGTVNTCVTIAELDPDGQLRVVGNGTVESQGIRRGVVVNIEKTTEAIIYAIDSAERMAGVKIRHASVGISAEHIRSLNSRGNITVSRSDSTVRSNVITAKDVERVIEAAQALALPVDRDVIHVLPQEYTIDDERGIRKPEGMTGLRLEAYVHIVTAANAAVQNITRCVENAGVEIDQVILEPLASSLAVLSEDDKEYGVAAIDIGGGTTDIAVYYNGSIRHTSVISLGGNNVTRDIAYVMGISREKAEELKIRWGGVYAPEEPEDKVVEGEEIVTKMNSKLPEVNLLKLNAIIRARQEEIYEMVLRELRRVDCLGVLASGIVLTGGGAMLKDAAKLAEEIFQRPVRIGAPHGVNGPAQLVNTPVSATSVGLILQAQTADRPYGNGHRVLEKTGMGTAFASVKSWLQTLVT
ncbi:cell division protein FtsA [Calditrichota bacterium]